MFESDPLVFPIPKAMLTPPGRGACERRGSLISWMHTLSSICLNVVSTEINGPAGLFLALARADRWLRPDELGRTSTADLYRGPYAVGSWRKDFHRLLSDAFKFMNKIDVAQRETGCMHV